MFLFNLKIAKIYITKNVFFSSSSFHVENKTGWDSHAYFLHTTDRSSNQICSKMKNNARWGTRGMGYVNPWLFLQNENRNLRISWNESIVLEHRSFLHSYTPGSYWICNGVEKSREIFLFSSLLHERQNTKVLIYLSDHSNLVFRYTSDILPTYTHTTRSFSVLISKTRTSTIWLKTLHNILNERTNEREKKRNKTKQLDNIIYIIHHVFCLTD